MTTEIWKDIIGYGGDYKASNLGSIISFKGKSPIVLHTYLGNTGYLRVVLTKNGIQKRVSVHRIIAELFVHKKSGGQVNHINGIKTDNSASNLEWCTASDNMIHADRKGLCNNNHFKTNNPFHGKKGKDNPKSKPILQILSDGTKKEWSSIADASRSLGTTRANISSCIRGLSNNAVGSKWEYKV